MLVLKNKSNRRIKMNQAKEIIGKKSGLLTAIEIIETNEGKKVKCVCDCGNEKTISLESFKYEKVKSCGCLYSKSKIKDITGEKFGKLTAIKFTGKIKN